LDGFKFTWCRTASDLWEEYCKNPDELKHFKDDLFNLNPKEFIDKYKFEDTNLEGAIIKCHEVYIHGKYIAVAYNTFIDKAICKKFGIK
jgi:hypothetical protein